MKKLHYSVQIAAPKEKVWQVMFAADTYEQWTKPFNPHSRFEGSWEEGSEILFIGSEEGSDEGISGMVSRIAENRPYEFMSIEHLGILRDGQKDFDSDEVKKWAPSFENYTFTDKDGGTELSIDVDMDEEYEEEFNEMWPKALEELKKLAEAE